jgi:hypothetical protein
VGQGPSYGGGKSILKTSTAEPAGMFNLFVTGAALDGLGGEPAWLREGESLKYPVT